jgi:hypothetical protein
MVKLSLECFEVGKFRRQTGAFNTEDTIISRAVRSSLSAATATGYIHWGRSRKLAGLDALCKM